MSTADLSSIPEGGFSPDRYLKAEFPRHSELCRSLEARYPGLRFNRVEVWLPSLHWFENSSPDADYVDVMFCLSGTCEAIERHGFHEPSYVHRQRTPTGFRFSGARYRDGLDRIAALMMPALLPWRPKEISGRS